MPRAGSHRSLLHALWIAAAILLLGAGVAFASAGRGHRVRHVRIGEARAVIGPRRCGAARLRRPRALRVRHRCGGRAASASGSPQPLYWGATIGPQLTGTQAPWDMNAVSKFEGIAGKPVSLIQFFQPFANCGSSGCKPYPFPQEPMESIRAHGSIPVLSWSSAAIPSSLDQPEFQLSDVIEGRYDSFITEFATAAKDWGHPFFLRFDWEMNASWMPWSEQVNGNQPGQYVAAWRHVHDIFAAVGATNATWVWCPYVDPSGSLQGLSSLYPGSEYVDWTALDGYNWGTNPSSPKGWRSFDQVFSATYARVTEQVAPGKPMMIAEMGSSEDGGSKSAWIAEALEDIPAEFPQIRAMLWFDTQADGMDWPIETSSSASGAFANGIKRPVFTGNSFANLPSAPIQPPG